MCMVTKPWICRFRLSTPDCEHHVNRSDVTCSIYCGHISPEMYDSLKSLQITTSFQPCRPLSLAYFLAFFVFHSKNHATFFHSDKLDFKTKKKLKISYCFQCYLVIAWFPHTLLATLSCALSHLNLCCV